MSEGAYVSHRLRGQLPGRTHYRREGSGEPVILVHGVGLDASIWQPQIESLCDAYDVIAIDMLGHGGSSLPPPDARLSDYADQLIAVADGLGLGKAHVIGHSMGALVGLEFALSHPGRSLSLVALNAVYCRTPEARAAVEARATAIGLANSSNSPDAPVARWFGDPVPSVHVEHAARVRHLLLSGNRTGYARSYRLFATSDTAHRDKLPRLAVPALFMTGALDRNSVPAMSRAMAAAIPGAQYAVVEEAGHMMTLTAAEEVNHRLRSFLGSAGGTRERAQTSIREAPGMAAPAAPRIDPRDFRKALGAFATGVTVVTTLQPDGIPRGFTANSFTSVSLEPPLVLVCIAKAAASCEVFAGASHFAVSILAEDQKDVSSLFASKAHDKFAAAKWFAGPSASPIIAGAAAWFDCRRHNVIEAGDHVILVGQVDGFDQTPARPLGYCRGAYITFSLEQDALTATAERVRVGAILERGDAIVLLERSDGTLDLPAGRSLETETDPNSLRGALRGLGIEATIDFLFAVFQETGGVTDRTSIYYRGSLDGPLPLQSSARLILFDEIPWARVRDEAMRSMLERFVRERREDTFGIYVGDAERGTVQPLAHPHLI